MSHPPQLLQVRDVLAEGECHGNAAQQLPVSKPARTDLALVPKESTHLCQVKQNTNA